MGTGAIWLGDGCADRGLWRGLVLVSLGTGTGVGIGQNYLLWNGSMVEAPGLMVGGGPLESW